jgi:hypothetical protein
VFCLFYKNKRNVSRSKTGFIEFSIRFHEISFESNEITRTDKVLLQCHFECFVCFTKTSKMYREVRRGLSSSRYNDSAVASPSLELTKCCFNVTSSLPAFLGRQVIFDRKLYREVRRGLSSSRYNGSAVASPSLELTKCCFNVTSSVLFVLKKQAKCIEK